MVDSPEVPATALTIPSRPLRTLSNDQVESIHEASLRILEETGILVQSECGLDLLARAGAEVDRSTQWVRLPRELVLKAISLAPQRFTLYARNPARNVEIGGDQLVLAPVGGPVMVSDRDYGRRSGTYVDQVNFIKLAQQARVLDMPYRCVEAMDRHPNTRDLDYLYAAIRYSDKPLAVMSLNAQAARDCLAMAAIVFGGPEAMAGRSVILGGVNVDSPLRFSETTVEHLFAFAEAGQPISVTPFAMPGVMSPASLGGALAQQNAEALAGIVLVQLIRPGAPVVYGSFSTVADMRTTAPVFGTAEGMLMEIAAGQLAERYRLPRRGLGMVTTTHFVDAQAGWEKMNCLWTLAMSNTHLLIHAAGWLDSGMTASYEQFAIDLEMLASFERFLKGFDVDDVPLAVEDVAKSGPTGSYLLSERTLSAYREIARISPLVDSRSFDAWSAEGAPTLYNRANPLWKKWLVEYEDPGLDPAIDDALRAYMASRGVPPAE